MKNTTYAQGRGWGTLSGPACGDPITMKTETTTQPPAAGEAAQTPLFLYVGSLRAAMAALIANKQPMPVQHMRDYLASLRDLHQDALNAYDSDQRKIKALEEVAAAADGLLAILDEPALGDLEDRKERLCIALALAKEGTQS